MDAPGALLTDLYEFTMAAAYVAEGMAERPATFSLFVRNLPPERGYLIAAGLDDALAWLEDFRFGDAEMGALAALDLFDDEFLEWLRTARFTGAVRAVPEGAAVFASEPLLEVDGPLGVAQLAESYLLNQVTLQTTLATKCARCVDAAAPAAVVDFSLRRAQGVDAAMKVARCARIAGLAATSNVAGGSRYGLPATGTMAHAFVQAYDREADAFRAFADCFGERTILLVDTYDTRRGVERAIEVAGEMRARGVELRGVRLDSGDLVELSKQARATLDDAGFAGMQVFASGSLDEYAIESLIRAGARIDAYGVGTSMGVSRDAPSLDTVYKLVEYDGRPVRKTSEGKATWPGRKQVWRRPGFGGDVVGLWGEPGLDGAEPLLTEVMRAGDRVGVEATDLEAAAARCAAVLDSLPEGVRRLRESDSYPVTASRGLAELTASLPADHP
ncbi:MAG: nicotinate phosphoribosyltransferase [Actinobacteria bacterium]|nr:nicotinate phosphoribosyltransferase [Actinomycetota bacterium]